MLLCHGQHHHTIIFKFFSNMFAESDGGICPGIQQAQASDIGPCDPDILGD